MVGDGTGGGVGGIIRAGTAVAAAAAAFRRQGSCQRGACSTHKCLHLISCVGGEGVTKRVG